jgi:hypothetical protein
LLGGVRRSELNFQALLYGLSREIRGTLLGFKTGFLLPCAVFFFCLVPFAFGQVQDSRESAKDPFSEVVVVRVGPGEYILVGEFDETVATRDAQEKIRTALRGVGVNAPAEFKNVNVVAGESFQGRSELLKRAAEFTSSPSEATSLTIVRENPDDFIAGSRSSLQKLNGLLNSSVQLSDGLMARLNSSPEGIAFQEMARSSVKGVAKNRWTAVLVIGGLTAATVTASEVLIGDFSMASGFIAGGVYGTLMGVLTSMSPWVNQFIRNTSGISAFFSNRSAAAQSVSRTLFQTAKAAVIEASFQISAAILTAVILKISGQFVPEFYVFFGNFWPLMMSILTSVPESEADKIVTNTVGLQMERATALRDKQKFLNTLSRTQYTEGAVSILFVTLSHLLAVSGGIDLEAAWHYQITLFTGAFAINYAINTGKLALLMDQPLFKKTISCRLPLWPAKPSKK